jgi:hypothetical protein
VLSVGLGEDTESAADALVAHVRRWTDSSDQLQDDVTVIIVDVSDAFSTHVEFTNASSTRPSIRASGRHPLPHRRSAGCTIGNGGRPLERTHCLKPTLR